MKLNTHFHNRSYKTEMIDLESTPSNDRIRNVKELDFFGKISGSNYYAWREIYKIIKEKEAEYNIVDLGCGGGETLKYFAISARNKGIKIKFTGVDTSDIVIKYMKLNCSNFDEITGVNTEFENFIKNTSQRIDIIYCSLFCHHLRDTEIICLMKSAKAMKSVLIIHDLLRSRLLYYGSYILTRILGGSELSKHDGPISVLKAFKKSEIFDMAVEAGYNNFKYKAIPFHRFIMVFFPS